MTDPNEYTTPFSFTKEIRRDPYPFLSPTKPELSQEGKVVIITGAGTGIGAAAAKVFAKAGAQGIVITGRRLEPLQKTEGEIKAINKDTTVLLVQGDISVEKDVIDLFAKVQKEFGKPAEVLINNAAVLDDGKSFAEHSVDSWWRTMEINVKGLVAMLHHYINTQPDPKKPEGTVVSVLSGRVGIVLPQGSPYNVSKWAEQRVVEHVQAEYPTLRMFMSMPGIVHSSMAEGFWVPYAKDHADLTGLQALYLTTPVADYLKGTMLSVNWDLEVMEAHKGEIVDKKLLAFSWIPSLPAYGGQGLGA
ncbi:hypothetical protein BJ875DRAFT_473237 [Amylocarpus encephaloides]|uniref:NAD(P)-binding protein n=1 Tax=Amylocarpus encephaloides TaxID=45428 RepID=A0A9P8C1M9_9HELO|nr:hypothetical protein BJ875DRAFT_473237 [Amylocarpus encephaloides]